MARLADYFIVVGYDQEKAGKFGGEAARRLSCDAEVCVQAVSQCVGMLMLDSSAISLTLATKLHQPRLETLSLFFVSFTGQMLAMLRRACIFQIKHTPGGKSPVDL